MSTLTNAIREVDSEDPRALQLSLPAEGPGSGHLTVDVPARGLRMAPEGSVSHWIHGVKAGDDGSAQRLFERYYVRLVKLGQARLSRSTRRFADGEDVALEAFDSFCRGAARGRFPRLADRDDLWRLLVRITLNKAADLDKWSNRGKRGGGRVDGEGEIAGDDSEDLWARCVGEEPTPELAAELVSRFEQLLDILGRDVLREVAVYKMEGLTNDEVAQKLDCSRRSVTRKLAIIKKALEEQGLP